GAGGGREGQGAGARRPGAAQHGRDHPHRAEGPGSPKAPFASSPGAHEAARAAHGPPARADPVPGRDRLHPAGGGPRPAYRPGVPRLLLPQARGRASEIPSPPGLGLSWGVSQTYFQKGFNLKAAVQPMLPQSYHSQVVDRLKELNHAARAGDLVLRLAREFGFCYGVDRAVEYAYETREQFPDRRIFLSGEIIHNPEVNSRLSSLRVRILPQHRDPP